MLWEEKTLRTLDNTELEQEAFVNQSIALRDRSNTYGGHIL